MPMTSAARPPASSTPPSPTVDAITTRTGGAPARPGARPRHFAGLDGLRAVAVAAVIVYHVFPGYLPGGFIGVDIFFVISGFLITSLLLGEHDGTGRIRLGRFWQRRARRLLPALVCLVLVCSTAAWAIGGDVLVGIGRQILGAATFSSNWLAAISHTSYFSHDAPDLFRNLWSLAVEEQFYLVWPFVLLAVLLLTRANVRILLVFAIAAASAVEMALLFDPGTDPTRVYFGSDTHCFGLAIGAGLALIVRQTRPFDPDAGETAMQHFTRKWLPGLGVLSLAAVLFAAWWLHDDATVTYRGGLVAVSALTAILIWAAVSHGNSLGRWLDAAPLRYLGVRSYGIYLWHWPIFVLLAAAIPGAEIARASWLTGGLTIVLTLVISVLSYRFVEQPLRKYGFRGTGARIVHRMRVSRIQRPVAIGGLAVLVLGSCGTVAAAASAPSQTQAQSYVNRGRSAIQTPTPSPTPTPAPTASAPPSTPSTQKPTPTPAGVDLPTGSEITAIGDSVMLASAPELQEAFPGISIDAAVSRSMYAAPSILRSLADSGALRPVVLLALGTNGPIDPDTMSEIAGIVGDRELVLVNVQAPRSWTDGVNAELASFAAAHPTTTVLADWQTAISGHIDLLAGDEIHPGGAGGQIYADCVKNALTRFADEKRERIQEARERVRRNSHWPNIR